MEKPRIIRSKRKTIAIYINPDGSVTVRAPHHVAQAQIEGFLKQKESWIRAKQEQVRRMPIHPKKKTFAPGELFLFLGRSYPLEYVDDQRELLKLAEKFTLRKTSRIPAAEVFTAWYREQARKVIGERVARLAGEHGYTFKSVRISGARTRWGSCSTKGNLNFTWRLVMAPPEVIDYVVLHELAHLEIKDHSRTFWDRVAQLCPEYKERRKWLKEHSSLLTLDGH